LDFKQNIDDLYLLLKCDDDAFNCWEASRTLAYTVLDELIHSYNTQQRYHLDERYSNTLAHLLLQSDRDPALIARILQLPTPQQIAERYTSDIPVEAIVISHNTLRETLALRLYNHFSEKYHALTHEPLVDYNANAAARRQLQNTCLYYLVHSNNEEGMTTAIAQYHEARNMTNRVAALHCIANCQHPARQQLLDDFYACWQQDELVVDKWFSLQATSELPNTLDTVQSLLQHPHFTYKNPNKVYSLIGAFANHNFEHFHGMDGLGYVFLAEQVRLVDRINPQIAARLVTPLTYWQPHQPLRQDLMQQALQSILDDNSLSKNVFEIVSKALIV
jgi:aminopeptidase N